MNSARQTAHSLPPARAAIARKNLDRLDAYRAKVAGETIHPLDNAPLEELPALLASFEIEYHVDGATLSQADLEAADRARARLKFARIESDRLLRPHLFWPDGTVRVFTGALLMVSTLDARAHTDWIARGLVFAAGLALIAWGAWVLHRTVAKAS